MNKLDAVNTVLMAQGLNPVSTLEGDLPRDAQTALALLDQTTRTFQNEKFFFNTEMNYTLSVNELGEVTYPEELIRFVVPGQRWVEMREGRLYDRRAQSFTSFTSAVSGHAMFVLEWDRLPTEAQNYVANKTARLAYESFMGTDDTRDNLFREEMTARTVFEQADTDQAGYTMLSDPLIPYVQGSDYYPPSPRNLWN